MAQGQLAKLWEFAAWAKLLGEQGLKPEPKSWVGRLQGKM